MKFILGFIELNKFFCNENSSDEVKKFFYLIIKICKFKLNN